HRCLDACDRIHLDDTVKIPVGDINEPIGADIHAGYEVKQAAIGNNLPTGAVGVETEEIVIIEICDVDMTVRGESHVLWPLVIGNIRQVCYHRSLVACSDVHAEYASRSGLAFTCNDQAQSIG